ncbi:cytochrome P450 [Streptomyces sp. NPDC005538]|uniref:cytochrome P450 n=1 Tax=Streptomyces sp. NPDC005538 TaxID=3157043 RepID=UPI0033AD4687
MTTDPQVIPIAPGRLPLIGHALPLMRDRLAFLQRLRAYGPIVRITVGPKEVTVVNAPDLIQEMLTVKADEFTKGLLFEKLKLFGKDALPVAEGKPHLTRRRLMQPAFHRQQVNGYIETMRDTVTPAITSWQHGDVLDLKTEMQLMTQNTVMSVLLSARPHPEPAHAILQSVDRVFTAALRRALLPVLLLERLPTRRNRQVTTASRILRTAVGAVVAEHRANPDAYDDIVSLLLAVQDETGKCLSDDEILSEVIGLLAAGSETTAVVLAWLFYELGRHPGLEERLHDEVDTVLAGGPITAERLPQLAFTRQLVSETLRLYSPAWLVTRQATTSVQLGQTRLPAGTDLVWSPYTLHRDPGLYPDPLRFDPDRWAPERPRPPKGAFIPFGAGKRQCMGDAFAWAEATLIAALVASRWRLRPEPGAVVRPVGEITVHPSALRMAVAARHTTTARKAA